MNKVKSMTLIIKSMTLIDKSKTLIDKSKSMIRLLESRADIKLSVPY